MKPPADLPPLLVAFAEAFARRYKTDIGDFWDYVYRRKAPPPEWRDGVVAAFFPRVPPESFLPSPTDDSTIRTMRTEEIEAPKRGRPLGQGDIASKLPAALKAAGVTLAEVAAKAKRTPPSIRMMAYPKGHDSHRPAPRAVVDLLKREFGIPVSVWPEIVD